MAGNPQHEQLVEQMSALSKAKGFLGREFLTWLWYRSEIMEEPEALETRQSSHLVRFWVDDRIALESTLTQSHVHSMRGGNPSQSMEATAALMSGKTVRELKLGMEIENIGEFGCVLNGKDLAPRSLKLPDVDPTNESDSLVATRIAHTEVFVQCLDGLFRLFINERMQKDWETTGFAAIKRWMHERTQGLSDKSLH